MIKRWQRLRAKVFSAQNSHCADCGEKTALDLHHLTYTVDCHDGPPEEFPVGTWETENDVIGLCRECHDARHRDANGEYWRDPQEMDNYWEPWFK